MKLFLFAVFSMASFSAISMECRKPLEMLAPDRGGDFGGGSKDYAYFSRNLPRSTIEYIQSYVTSRQLPREYVEKIRHRYLSRCVERGDFIDPRGHVSAIATELRTGG